MVRSRPHVTLCAAISLDGKIATKAGDSRLSSKKDLERIHKLRSKADAILIGKNTMMKDNPYLTVRYAKGKNPIRIILDSSGKIKSNSKIIQTCQKIPTIIAVSENISGKNIARLQRYGLEVIKCGNKRVNLKKLLSILENRKIKKLLVEGGGIINWSFLKDNLVDEIIVTVTPHILGGKNAISFVEGDGFEKITNACKLKLKNIQIRENEIVLHYIV
ncbi:MAG: 2,5-diamino-6-(ribosylamino)-4(3H)-pyrimidinone 5'-phosphate reductase [Nitrosopumilaceae archaeon]